MTQEKITIGNKYPLDGLLTLPTGNGPFPAVVLVHGSGVSDMDSNVGAIRPFKDIAEGLAEFGVATIRYNKRAFTHWKVMRKDFPNDLTVFEETIEDAIFAKDLLMKDSRIKPGGIFVAGLSLGGQQAPRIAKMGEDFAGIIILAGTPRLLTEVIVCQQDNFVENSNALMKWLMKRPIRKMRAKFDGLLAMTDEEAKKEKFAGGTTMYYLLDMARHPVKKYLDQLELPVLVMHGDADLQVLTDKDFNRYKELLADHPDATFKLYPGLNHCFFPSTNTKITKVMKEFKAGGTVKPYVIKDIAEWVKVRG